MSLSKKKRQWLHASLSTGIPAMAASYGLIQILQGKAGWFELLVFFLFYLVTAIGVEIGCHRLFSHRAFSGNSPLTSTLAIFGCMAGQGPPIDWAVSHRTHHRFSDKPGDLHSPHTRQKGEGRSSFWHAHLGWLFAHDTLDYYKIAPDLFKDDQLLWINKHYLNWVALGLFLPTLLGFFWMGISGAAQGFLWGGLVRIFFVQHFTFLTNSLCHSFGAKDFRTEDESRNVPILSLLTLGSCLHNTHHAFPSSAKTALTKFHFDPGWWFIRSWQKLGWVDRAIVPRSSDVQSRLSRSFERKVLNESQQT